MASRPSRRSQSRCEFRLRRLRRLRRLSRPRRRTQQRKLTLQLGRNSFYFATAVFFIKQFGEQVAV